MGRLFYFAYGSNLHPSRLRDRAPSARLIGRARMRGYRLRFRKRGRDLSAKCDACWTGMRTDQVQGAVYSIARADRRALDLAEDVGRGYDRTRLWVSVGARRRVVFSYLTRPEAIDEGLQPYDWYLEYVVRGARHHGFSGRYISAMRRELVTRDPNTARRGLNRRLLLSGAEPYRRA